MATKKYPLIILSLFLLILSFFITATGCASQNVKRENDALQTGKQKSFIKIASASDLQPAFEEIGRIFEKRTGAKPVFIFGSSGQLAEQIVQGAEPDLYISADEVYVDKVIQAGKGIKETKKSYALGRIVIISGNKKIGLPKSIYELGSLPVNKIAIANPDHAPYGRVAKEAMISAGVWGALKPKIVYGENARQAFQYAETGNADMAIAPLSLALGAGARYNLIPKELHKPLVQTLVVINTENRALAKEFVGILESEEGQRIMKRYGFEKPVKK